MQRGDGRRRMTARMPANTPCLLRLRCPCRMTNTSSSYGGQEAVGKHLHKASAGRAVWAVWAGQECGREGYGHLL